MNLAPLIFIVVLFILSPRMALRGARQIRQWQADGIPVPRSRLVISTMFSLTVVWFLSQMNALLMGRNLFALGDVGMREVGIGLVGLAVLMLAIPISRAVRNPADERKRLMYSLAPRTGKEFALFALVALMAGIAEESAYRGVALWILQPIFGSIIPAIFLSAMAFAVAHAVQGGKAMAVIFGIALVFHAVVYLTNTLVIAMVIHVLYDLVAGYVARRRALELDREDAVAAAATPAAPPAPISAG